MNELQPVLDIASGFGVWVVFLWLFIRADNAQREERASRFDRIEARLERLQERVNEACSHIAERQ